MKGSDNMAMLVTGGEIGVYRRLPRRDGFCRSAEEVFMVSEAASARRRPQRRRQPSLSESVFGQALLEALQQREEE